jgi:hypothetical protein
MPKLKLGPLPDERPVRMQVTFTAEQHAQLEAYAHAVAAESGRAVEPARLVPRIVERFIATDRAFSRAKATSPEKSPKPGGQAETP